MNTYTSNTLLQLSVTFTRVNGGTPVDPTAVTLKVKLPDDTVQDLTSQIGKTGVGKYVANFMATMGGYHTYQWIGTGAAPAAVQQQFYVNPVIF